MQILITLAMRWTRRERQTKEEVGSQVLYATRGEGVQQGKRFLRTSYADGPEEGGCGCTSATDLALGGRASKCNHHSSTRRRRRDERRAVCTLEAAAAYRGDVDVFQDVCLIKSEGGRRSGLDIARSLLASNHPNEQRAPRGSGRWVGYPRIHPGEATKVMTSWLNFACIYRP